MLNKKDILNIENKLKRKNLILFIKEWMDTKFTIKSNSIFHFTKKKILIINI